MMLTFRKRQPIGMTIDDYSIRMVEVRGKGEVYQYKEKMLPEGIVLSGKIKDYEMFDILLEECVEDWKIRKRPVVFSVPDAHVVLRKEKVPKGLSEKEIRDYLQFEIGKTIHLPVSEPYFDFAVINELEEEQEIILFAGPQNVINAYAHALEEAALVPIAADISSLALFRLHPVAEEEKSILLLNYGFGAVNASFFYETQPAFMRYWDLNVSREMWADDPEQGAVWAGEHDFLHGVIQESITECERLLNFYRFSVEEGKHPLHKIYLSGEFPNLEMVQTMLEKALNIPVNIFDPQEDTSSLPVRFQTSLGLATKEV